MQSNNSHKVCILLPVWGHEYITEFLELNLPSLLAPGNIPALAAVYPLRFTFLTRNSDIPFFENNSLISKLKSICDIDFISISDLASLRSYSVTLTLAYDRGIKQAGEEMLNTYFIFLTSDYIMANGSLNGLMKYINKGYNGICSGNFQVIKENIKPFLLEKIDPITQTLVIEPRELLKHSFKNFHPIVFASMFEQTVSHNYHANRFFMRLDHTVLASRFYLLHMLCIKPETTDYRIGSSCDYSFIQEMCAKSVASGNIGIIDSSDDYLVIEAQSKDHELKHIMSGSYDTKKLARGLADWTTKLHRENAKHTIYFHMRDLTEEDKKNAETKLDKFINEISQNLFKFEEQPYFNHPYWIGAIKHVRVDKKNDGTDYEYCNIYEDNVSLFKKLHFKYYGAFPSVRPWHYRWSEYQSVMNSIKTHVKLYDNQHIAVFYDSYHTDFSKFNNWLKNSLKIDHHYYTNSLMHSPDKLNELKSSKFLLCILLTQVENLEKINNKLTMVSTLINKNGKLLLFIPNTKNFHSPFLYDFQGEFVYRIGNIMSSEFHIEKINSIYNNLTRLGLMWRYKTDRLFFYKRKRKFLFYIISTIPSTVMCLIINLFSKILGPKKGHCTNIIATLVPETEATHE